VISQIEEWIFADDGVHFVAVTGMHGIVESQHDESFKLVLDEADLVVPDGMPLVWLARWHGHTLEHRVYGPELAERFCSLTGAKYRHYFYGGAPGVACNLASSLRDRFAIRVAGTFSPPFRALTKHEDMQIVRAIRDAAPDILWVGLSTPKQERWIYQHTAALRVRVMIGIGAAFDLLTGRAKQAPRFMRESGFEWLFRLCHEPGRLWRRYLIYGPEFVWKASLEAAGVKKF